MAAKKKQQKKVSKKQEHSLMVSSYKGRSSSSKELANRRINDNLSLKIYNNKNVYFVKDDKSDHEGFIPLGYDCCDLEKYVDDLFVVKKFNPSKYEYAYHTANKKAYSVEKEANRKYAINLQKIALEKERDIVAAHVSSAYKIGKANLLVAMHECATSEQKRHDETLKRIKKSKPLLIEKNDEELKETLARLSYNHEIDILNLNANKNKRLAHLDKEKEIRALKASNMDKKIKNYSVGKKYNEKVSNQDISKISYKYKVYDSNEEILTSETGKIKRALSSINYNKLTAKEKAIYEKFMALTKKDDEVYKKLEEIYSYKDSLGKNKYQRKYMVVNYKNKNNILNANKEKFMIIEDAKKFANDYRSLHQLYETYEPVEERSSLSVRKRDIEDEYSKREIIHSIHKWERVLKAIEKNDDYNITNLGNGYYKINYLTNVDYHNNYQDDRKNFFANRTEILDDEMNPKKSKQTSFINSFSESWNNMTQSIKDRKKFYSPAKMKKLYADYKQLIDSDIVQENINLFHQNGLYLDKILFKFNTYNLDSFERNDENLYFIKDELGRVFKLYYYLVDEKIEAKKRIELSDKLRRQQDAINQRNLVYFNNQTIRIDQDYKKACDKKNKKYEKAVEHAKNMHFIRGKEILESCEQAIANEHKRHYQNVALYKQQIKQEETKLYNVQNQKISLIIRKIQAFNNKNPEDKISIANLPVLINPKASASQNIKIRTDYENNRVIASTRLKEHELLLAKTLNKNMPISGYDEIVVLDKFRSIEDPYKRSAVLKELAKNELEKALSKIAKFEAEEINIANANFKKQMKIANNIKTDAEVILLQKEIFNSHSEKFETINNAKKRFGQNVKEAVENNSKKTETKITKNTTTKKRDIKPLPMSEKDQNLFIQKIQRKLSINHEQDAKTKVVSKKTKHLALSGEEKKVFLDEVIGKKIR